jgi:serine phosphatase RsbU (regulator of sigma subunit)
MNSFNDSFILFKPKDIVSGDFYFFKPINGLIFIAAADCTGHGVPGAFMSMICAEKLEEALILSNDTSEILSLLNKGIKTSLKQSDHEESTRDGMDIAICAINLQENTLTFAGANRPLWFIKNGENKVEEIKGTKKAIGGTTDYNQFFESHSITTFKGDTFYLCTDGYADIFSSKGKKLTTKKLKQVLIEIQSNSMSEQMQHLNDYAINWEDGAEQTDDILIIGIRT